MGTFNCWYFVGYVCQLTCAFCPVKFQWLLIHRNQEKEMGETEISTVGAKVCHLPNVGTSPDGGSQSVKPETSVAFSSPSPSPSESPQLSTSNGQCKCPPDCICSMPTMVMTHGFLKMLFFVVAASQKTYDCTECGKKFSKPSKLKNHMHLHSGEVSFRITIIILALVNLTLYRTQ